MPKLVFTDGLPEYVSDAIAEELPGIVREVFSDPDDADSEIVAIEIETDRAISECLPIIERYCHLANLWQVV
jgi:hypothetical protein